MSYTFRLFLKASVLLLLLAVTVSAFAQNKKNLEDKRKKLTREIELTNKLLDKTKLNKTAAYDRFVTLQNQIDRRESLIQTIENEVIEYEDDIQRNTAVIEALHLDLAKMKTEYGRMIRNSFRRKTLSNPLMYLISAENLNQVFRRWLFLRKYNRFRNGQAEAITFTQTMLSKKVTSIGEQKQEKENLLIQMQGLKGTLTNELTDKNDLLKSLEKNEEKLRSDLKDKQAAKAALDNSIEQIIGTEVRKREVEEATRKRNAAEKAAAAVPKPKEEKKPTSSPPTTTTATTPAAPIAKAEKNAAPTTKPATPSSASSSDARDEDAFSQAFRKQRGKLPWPVEDGFVSRSFGRQKHPTLKNIEITNNGIDIRSTDDAPVHAIYEGKVAGVQYIPGHDYTVIIQHGNYYTVYSNLSQTNLSKGDNVGAGANIGRVSTNPISGAAELHFELWREKERLNPAVWIK
jgi:septal ring factor EnvC (AmiA/AmiB activator)